MDKCLPPRQALYNMFPLRVGANVIVRIDDGKLVVEPLPRFQHYNISPHDDVVRVIDNFEDKIAEVYMRSDGVVYCELCESTDCKHIEYALELPETQERIKKMGWKRKNVN